MRSVRSRQVHVVPGGERGTCLSAWPYLWWTDSSTRRRVGWMFNIDIGATMRSRVLDDAAFDFQRRMRVKGDVVPIFDAPGHAAHHSAGMRLCMSVRTYPGAAAPRDHAEGPISTAR